MSRSSDRRDHVWDPSDHLREVEAYLTVDQPLFNDNLLDFSGYAESASTLRIATGEKVYIHNYDPGDDTYLVTFARQEHPGEFEYPGRNSYWIDCDCLSEEPPYAPVTDEEMADVFRMLGVDP